MPSSHIVDLIMQGFVLLTLFLVLRDIDDSAENLQGSLMGCGSSQLLGTNHVYNSMKKIPELDMKRENLGLELEGNCTDAMDYSGRENMTSTSMTSGLSLHWMANSNPVPSINMMSTQHHVRSPYLQV